MLYNWYTKFTYERIFGDLSQHGLNDVVIVPGQYNMIEKHDNKIIIEKKKKEENKLNNEFDKIIIDMNHQLKPRHLVALKDGESGSGVRGATFKELVDLFTG